MCYKRWKTPVNYPDCTGPRNECTKFEPDHDHVQQCDARRGSTSYCDPITQTSQGSSTRRKINCPKHRLPGSTPNSGSSGAAGGAGAAGAGGAGNYSLGVQAPGLRV
ncbi:hypothetical protein L228DRAFT_242568, partial [Xylona heveae TC161]